MNKIFKIPIESMLFLALLGVPNLGLCQKNNQSQSLPLVSGIDVSGHNQSAEILNTNGIRADDLASKKMLTPPKIQQAVRQEFEHFWKLNKANIPAKIQLKSGGSWSGGGGTGVVCFRGDVKARELFDSSGRLKTEGYSQITMVSMVDNFYKSSDPYLDIEISEQPFEVIKKVLDRYKPFNTNFFNKLMIALDTIDKSLLVMNSEGLPRTWDTNGIEEYFGKSRELYPHCELIQIAIRYSHHDKDGNLVESFIDVDQNLLNYIRTRNGGPSYESIYNESLIWLHEAIYLISNHSNAKNIVLLTDFLFNQKTFNFISSLSQEEAEKYLNDKLKKLGF